VPLIFNTVVMAMSISAMSVVATQVLLTPNGCARNGAKPGRVQHSDAHN